jgi:hypothetical protein
LKAEFEPAGLRNDRERAFSSVRRAFDDLQRLRALRHRDDGDAVFDDPGLFRGDLLQGIAQELHVIPADGRDDADGRRDGVRGIQSAPHPGFEHDPFIPTPREPIERERKRELKKRRMRIPVADELTQAREAGFDLAFGDAAARIADALREVDKVWRGEKACVVPCGLQNGVDEGAGAAFAIRARDVDEPLPRLRHAELPQQPVHGIQPQLDAEHLRGVEPGEGRGHGRMTNDE